MPAHIAKVPPPNTYALTILAQDPSVRVNGRMVLAQVDVPAEQLAAGPTGYRAKVVDYDSSTDHLYATQRYAYAKGWLQDPFRPPTTRAARPEYERRLLEDPGFHAQNVYAIAMRTLARFEYALGRRVAWGFGGHQIHIAPHAFADANAFYAEAHRGLFFGYFTDDRGRPIFSCLSHDVVAHETTHAILDGLRDRYTEPSSPDQAAFHEGFADVVALLSVFSLPEIVAALLQQPADDPDTAVHRTKVINKRLLTHDALANSVLLGLAEQMGQALSKIRGQPLRRSAKLPPNTDYLNQREFEEPHRRGEILVAAMLNAFIAIWRQRLETLAVFPGGQLDATAVVDAGARAADHLLTIAIRAIDYCPTTDISFSNFLSALLTADVEVVPDDRKYDYRKHLLDQFAQFGIPPAPGSRSDGAWPRDDLDLSYSRTHFDSLTRDPDEVFRFLWENRTLLELDPNAYMQVDTVRPCIRVGPDGFVLRETVATYVQIMTLQAGELVSILGIHPPKDMPKTQELWIYGGGALIFNEYGHLKYHIPNRLRNDKRQSARLDYLWRAQFFDVDTPKKINFAAMHMRRALG